MRTPTPRRRPFRSVASSLSAILLLATGATDASALVLPPSTCFLGPPPQAEEPLGTLVASTNWPLTGAVEGVVSSDVYREPGGTLAFLYSFAADAVLPPGDFTSFWLDVGGFSGWHAYVFLVGPPNPYDGGICFEDYGASIRIYAEEREVREETSVASAQSPSVLFRTDARHWTTVPVTAATYPLLEGHGTAYAPAVAPEPSTLLLVATGIAATAALAARRRRARGARRARHRHQTHPPVPNGAENRSRGHRVSPVHCFGQISR